MIIAPTTTPAALIDQSAVNQSQQQQVQSAEQSRKASITVQFSSEALELAGAENKEAPQQKRQEAFKSIESTPATAQPTTDTKTQLNTESKIPVQQQVEVLVTQQVNAAVEANKQQPINPTSKQPENSKINILA